MRDLLAYCPSCGGTARIRDRGDHYTIATEDVHHTNMCQDNVQEVAS